MQNGHSEQQAGLKWIAGIIVLLVALTAWPGVASAAPLSKNPIPSKALSIAPFSKTPPSDKPFYACLPPTTTRASCDAVNLPAPAARALGAGALPALEGSGVSGGLSPSDLRAAYNISSEAGKGQTIAIVDAFDDPNAESDLGVYRTQYGLPACTTVNGCFKKVNQAGEAANYPKPNAGWSTEISLDLDMASAACPQCNIVLVEATDNLNTNLDAAQSTAVALGATVISNSWGNLESAAETERDKNFNHPGIPTFFSSGDGGYGVGYPAASRYVTAVGGTALRKDTGSRGWREEVWSNAGSGCSAYEPKPAWQHDTQCPRRMTADVSAVGAPETGLSVYDSFEAKGWLIVGGTSASTPIVAGITALQSKTFREKGAEAFYESRGPLIDVTTGLNGECTPPAENEFFCTGQLGYDGPTGNGTPGLKREGKPIVSARATAPEPYGATFKGTVDPEGAATTYRFEYGTTTSYGSKWPTKEGSAGSGLGNVSVSTQPSDLSPETTYHYRLVATNSKGSTYGEDETFATIGTGWAPHPTYTSTFGSSPGHPGSGEGQLNHPTSIAVNPKNGILAVADAENNRIQEFTASGKYIRQFGTKGSGTGQFVLPQGVAFDEAGSLYVSDWGNDRIQKFSETGSYLSSLTGEGTLDGPWGLAVDSAGNVWVADSNNNLVRELNPAGNRLQLFGVSSRPTGLALDAEGNIWNDNDAGQIEEHSPSKTLLQKFGVHGTGYGQLWAPRGLTVDAKGNVWVADQQFEVFRPFTSRIQVFSPTGRFEGSFGTFGTAKPEQMQYPGDIALDPRGNVWIADTSNNRVQRWVVPSKWPPTYASSFGAPVGYGYLTGAAVNPRTGNVAVVDRALSKVELFTPQGSLIRQFETKALVEKPTGPCQFSEPRGISFDEQGNNLYVAGYKCVEKFSEAGTYLSAFGVEGSGNGQFGATTAVDVDSNEHVWVMDAGNNRVEEFTSGGEYLSQFAVSEQAWGIAVDGQGNVWNTASPGRIEEHSQSGLLVRTFGDYGSESGQLKSPGGLAVDTEGDVWVADRDNDRISVFASNGELLDEFSSAELESPQDLALDPHGDIFILNDGISRVERWTIASKWPLGYAPSFDASFGGLGFGNGQFKQSSSVAVNPTNGNLAVVDAGNNRVQVLNRAGEYIRQFGTAGSGAGQFQSPLGAAFDAKGNLYVADYGNNRIEKFSEAGAFLSAFGTEGSGSGQFKHPDDVTVGPNGDLWVADCSNGRIEHFTATGASLNQFTVPGCPLGVTVDASGKIYNDLLFPSRIEVHSENGELLRTISSSGSGVGQLSEARGLTVDAEGRLWVADTGHSKIEVFDTRGAFVGSFGTSGAGAGQFASPYDVALDPRGGIWVADRGNNRVSRWK